MTSNSTNWNLTLLFLLFYSIQTSFAQSNVNLSDFVQCGNLVPIPEISDNLSGVTYNYSDDKLYAITNDPTMMYRLSMEGEIEVTYQLTGFLDTEGLVYMGGNMLAIAEEGRNNIVFIQIPQEDETLQEIAYPNTIIDLNISTSSNKGIEGIAFDAGTNTMYVCQEKFPTKIFSIQNPVDKIGTEIIPEVRFTNFNGIIDMAGLTFYNGALILLSEDSDEVVEINLSTNSIESTLDNLIHTQAEGVTFTAEGELIIVGEPNQFVRYKHSSIGCEDQLADLAVSCGTLNVDGSTIGLTDVVVGNVGQTTAADSYVGYFLSTDETITTDDIFVGQDFVSQLGSGELTIQSFDFDSATLGIPSGTYYLGVIADYQNAVAEESESNNVCYIAVDIGLEIDLEVSCGELLINDSDVLIHNIRITNVGTLGSGYSMVGYYISSDSHITTEDRLIGNDYVNPLAPNEFSAESFTFNIDQLSLPPGTYYFGAIADYLSLNDERDIGNNTCSILLDVNGQNEMSDIVAECGDIDFQSDRLAIIDNIRTTNIGEEKSDVTYNGVFLSLDLEYGPEDILVVDEYISKLEPGDSKTHRAVVNVSARDLPTGEYYILIVADYKNSVSESDEENNVCYHSSQTINIINEQAAVDLVMDCGDVEVSGSIIQYSNVSVMNNGNSTANTYGFVGYYLSSTNEIPGSPSYLLGSDYFPTLSGAATSSESISVDLNNYSYIVPGTYYIGAKVDYSGRISESNENNNVCFSNETVTINSFSDGAETRSFINNENYTSDVIHSIYPNPALSGTSLTITLNTGINNSNIKMFNANGKLVYSEVNITNQNVVVNTNEMTKGLYYIKVSNGTEVHTSKVILQ